MLQFDRRVGEGIRKMLVSRWMCLVLACEISPGDHASSANTTSDAACTAPARLSGH